MALLITTANRPIFVDAETANLLWLIKTGERKGTPKTCAKVKTIDKWYLNRDTAPDSYLKQNPLTVTKKVRGYSKTVTQGRLPYVD